MTTYGGNVDATADLSASVIPTAVYPAKKWYMVGDDESWYYHGPREVVEVDLQVDFDQTVDPALQELVDFLHLRRIPTTPSCQGHFHPQEEFESVWSKLKAEAQQIRENGLKLIDVETGEEVLFKDPNYKLPWNSFQDFYQVAGTNQQKGYIGFYVRDPGVVHHLRHLLTGPSKFNFFREVGRIDNAVLFALGVRQKDEEEQRKAWRSWTKRIKDAFLGLY